MVNRHCTSITSVYRQKYYHSIRHLWPPLRAHPRGREVGSRHDRQLCPQGRKCHSESILLLWCWRQIVSNARTDDQVNKSVNCHRTGKSFRKEKSGFWTVFWNVKLSVLFCWEKNMYLIHFYLWTTLYSIPCLVWRSPRPMPSRRGAGSVWMGRSPQGCTGCQCQGKENTYTPIRMIKHTVQRTKFVHTRTVRLQTGTSNNSLNG